MSPLDDQSVSRLLAIIGLVQCIKWAVSGYSRGPGVDSEVKTGHLHEWIVSYGYMPLRLTVVHICQGR